MGGQPGGQDERGESELEFGSVKVQKIMKIEVGEFHFEILCQVGNINAKLKYEQWVPPSYRKVDSSTPQVLSLFRTLFLHILIIHFRPWLSSGSLQSMGVRSLSTLRDRVTHLDSWRSQHIFLR